MIRLEGHALAGQPGPAAAPPEDTPEQTGTFRGDQVTVKNMASELAEAAEEITLFHSEKAESKRFAERECRGERRAAVVQVEQIMAYLDAVQAYDDPQKLAELAKRLQSNQSPPRELARQQSRDPAQQFALLQYALHDGENNGTPAEALESLRDAIADLEMEHGPQIRASLNTVDSAVAYARQPGDIATFQAAYQDVVLGDATLSQTMRLMVDRLGGPEGEDLARGLQSMTQALGTDLSAARPSTDSNRLQALVQDLYHLEVAATVLDGCRGLATALADKHATPGVRPVELMKELVTVTGEKWVGATRFTALGERFGVREPGAQIAFHTSIKFMMRDLPVKVFPDPETRQSVLNATQEALDIAIDKEEE